MIAYYPLSTEYQNDGLILDGTLSAHIDIDGVSPNGTYGGWSIDQTWTWTFTEVQPAVSFVLFDVSDSITIMGYAENVLLYSYSIAVQNEDGLPYFLGMTFGYGVDQLVIENDSSMDIWGVDDISFSQLGLDDADGDGYTEADGDCDDSNAAVSPDGIEVYYDGIDGNCDGANDFDADGDGHVSTAYGGTDCDESDPGINPDAEEIWYDGVDSNCDNWSDYDADMDGYDSYSYGTGTVIDCDDGNSAVNPDAEEIFYDSTDDNCNPLDDYDADGDGFPAAGFGGFGGFAEDCDDLEASVNPDAEEVFYDGVDSDCDGGTDFDSDGDGYEAEAYGGTDCNDDQASVNPGVSVDFWYDGIDSNCDGASDYDRDGDGFDSDLYAGSDCDDTDGSINPNATDLWYDGIDQDCDGASDFDVDQDGFPSIWYGGTDCNDSDNSIHPNATETW